MTIVATTILWASAPAKSPRSPRRESEGTQRLRYSLLLARRRLSVYREVGLLASGRPRHRPASHPDGARVEASVRRRSRSPSHHARWQWSHARNVKSENLVRLQWRVRIGFSPISHGRASRVGRGPPHSPQDTVVSCSITSAREEVNQRQVPLYERGARHTRLSRAALIARRMRSSPLRPLGRASRARLMSLALTWAVDQCSAM